MSKNKQTSLPDALRESLEALRSLELPVPRISAEGERALHQILRDLPAARALADENHESFLYQERQKLLAGLQQAESTADFNDAKDRLLNLEARKNTLREIGFTARVRVSGIVYRALVIIREEYAREIARFDAVMAEARALHERLATFDLSAQPLLDRLSVTYARLKDAKSRADKEEGPYAGYFYRNPVEEASMLGYRYNNPEEAASA